MRVIQTIQSEGNDPVDVTWYTGDSLAQVISAAASALAQKEDRDEDESPFRVTTLSVRITMD